MSAADDGYIKRHEPLWGNWYIEDLIGEGSFGKVYRIYREEWGFKYVSALKLVNVPTKEQYREAAAVFSNREEHLYSYFLDAVKGIINEIHLMYALRGNSNIISYEDHLVAKKPEGMGWDILIRMELATPLLGFLSSSRMSRERIIRLGTDICSALEACSNKGIIHRDIKDENIFISNDERFKLGDFGIARVLSKSSRAASVKGTPIYMAPEIYRGENYDIRADLYSLGVVLYKLLNYGRIPFLPPYPEEIKYKDSEAALEKRMSGLKLPCPQQATPGLGSVIVRACSFNPSERYSAASEMKKALEEVLGSMSCADKDELITNLKPKTETFVQPAAEPLFSSTADTVILKPTRRAEGFQENETLRLTPAYPSAAGGNTPGNLANGGLFTTQGHWIYYSTPSGSRGIYKIRHDGSERLRLSINNAWFINTSGSWLYFSNPDDGDGLYKMKTDGSEKIRLCNDRSWDLNVDGEWIYYCNESDDYGIYRIKTDGSNRTKLCSDHSGSLNVSDGWLYYSNKNDKGFIYKTSIGGNTRERLNTLDSDCINVSGGWIYYLNRSDNSSIYRMRTDGSGNTRLNNDFSSNINLAGDWIYYSNRSDKGRIYRIRTDGSEKTGLNDDNCDYINVLGEWIYYFSKNGRGRFFKMGLNGEDRTVLEDEVPSDTGCFL